MSVSSNQTIAFLNNDDDNNNNIADFMEVGPILGENDLIPISLGFSGCPPNTECGEQLFIQFSNRLYENNDKTNKFRCRDYSSIPANLYFEMFRPTNACGQPIYASL